MFRWILWLLLVAAVGWLGATVPLGKRTLIGHLQAIAGSKEAKDLADGTKEGAGKMADRVREMLGRDAGVPPGKADKAPVEKTKPAARHKVRPAPVPAG